MRVALSASLFSQVYTIHDVKGGPRLAEVTLPGLLKPGSIQVGPVPYEIRAATGFGRRTTLWFEGVEVGAAERPSAWRSDVEVTFEIGDSGSYLLRRRSAFTSTYAVEDLLDGAVLGTIDRPGWFRTDMEIDLPETIPFLAQAFLFATVLGEMRRQQSG